MCSVADGRCWSVLPAARPGQGTFPLEASTSSCLSGVSWLGEAVKIKGDGAVVGGEAGCSAGNTARTRAVVFSATTSPLQALCPYPCLLPAGACL